MSDFEVNVVRIDDVQKHPDADRLDIVTIGGYLCIANKHEDGSSRYQVGDLVVYIPEQSVLPEWMMKRMEFWDVNKNKPSFRYVKAKKLRGIFSQGILYPAIYDDGEWSITRPINDYMDNIQEGDNVAEFLGIIKYEPIVPQSMRGQASGEFMQYTMKYDFESIQKHPSLFEQGEEVVVTEKIHGTLVEIGYIPEFNHPELFNGNIFVTSKGIAKQGFVYKNLEANNDNLYVKVLKELLDQGLAEWFQSIMEENRGYISKSIHVFGEIFGEGVQDLGYGQKKPIMRVFDIALDREFNPFGITQQMVYLETYLDTVPVLYTGPFHLDNILPFRDGPSIFDSKQIREGVVISANDGSYHPRYGRKIAKWVSPDYLLRKGNTTEFG